MFIVAFVAGMATQVGFKEVGNIASNSLRDGDNCSTYLCSSFWDL